MQPQSHLAIAPCGADVQGRYVASTPTRLASEPLYLSGVLTDLSATVSQLRGLQQRHVGDAGLESRLRRTAVELEALISHLLHTDGSGSSPPTTPRSPASTPRQRAMEQAFLVWLAEPTSADELPLDGSEGPAPLARVLGELSLSGRVLPAETAARVGLPDGTTVGHAAAELLLVVKDPAGPRCRSFRAAVYYLRDLDRGRVIEPDDRQVG